MSVHITSPWGHLIGCERSGPRKKVIELDTLVADLIYFNEPTPASSDELQSIFMPYWENGTFTLGERSSRARFIRDWDRSELDLWLREVVARDLYTLRQTGNLEGAMVSTKDLEAATRAIVAAFSYPVANDRPLSDLVPNQNYIDYIRRGIGLYFFGDPAREFDTESSYTQPATELALEFVDRFFPGLHPEKQMRVAIQGGLLGLDTKCQLCAASDFDSALAVSVLDQPDPAEAWEELSNSVDRNTSNEAKNYFQWSSYERHVLNRTCRLAYFPDDLPETVLDLGALQTQLLLNPSLSINIIPRAGRYHNDASYSDVSEIIEQAAFAPIKDAVARRRVTISDCGPRSGAVEGTKLSSGAARAINAADVVYFKGSRTFELIASGIRKRCFFGQTVTREFSESVTGVDAQVAYPILLENQCFPAFWGFRERHCNDRRLWPTGRTDWAASMTSADSSLFTRSSWFLNASKLIGREVLSMYLVALASTTGKPPHLLRPEIAEITMSAITELFQLDVSPHGSVR